MNEAETRAEHAGSAVIPHACVTCRNLPSARSAGSDRAFCPCEKCGRRPCICRKKGKAKVELADGKERTIQHMMVTSYWHPDGTPMSGQQFMEMLYGKLPESFKDEAELRLLWSSPDTRSKLLTGLADMGFGTQQLSEMQRVIDAEKSDLFDVLAYVAYAMPTLTREQRATAAKAEISARFDSKQQAFVDFVLAHYVSVGVEELDQEKLTPLLRLRYTVLVYELIHAWCNRIERSNAFIPSHSTVLDHRVVRLGIEAKTKTVLLVSFNCS